MSLYGSAPVIESKKKNGKIVSGIRTTTLKCGKSYKVEVLSSEKKYNLLIKLHCKKCKICDYKMVMNSNCPEYNFILPPNIRI